jgi:hypothetical protein
VIFALARIFVLLYGIIGGRVGGRPPWCATTRSSSMYKKKKLAQLKLKKRRERLKAKLRALKTKRVTR